MLSPVVGVPRCRATESYGTRALVEEETQLALEDGPARGVDVRPSRCVFMSRTSDFGTTGPPPTGSSPRATIAAY